MMGKSIVILIGNLTRDPDLRYTTSGAAVVSFTLAINEKYGDKEEVTFVKVSAWGKVAENCGKYLVKGKPVLIDGRLRLNQWETDSGEKRQILEVTAKAVLFLGGKQGGASDSANGSGGQNDDIPF